MWLLTCSRLASSCTSTNLEPSPLTHTLDLWLPGTDLRPKFYSHPQEGSSTSLPAMRRKLSPVHLLESASQAGTFSGSGTVSATLCVRLAVPYSESFWSMGLSAILAMEPRASRSPCLGRWSEKNPETQSLHRGQRSCQPPCFPSQALYPVCLRADSSAHARPHSQCDLSVTSPLGSILPPCPLIPGPLGHFPQPSSMLASSVYMS